MFKRHSTIRSPKLAEKKKKQFWIKSGAGMFALVVILSIPPILSQIPALNIQNIEVSGNEVITRDEIESYIREKISGNYFGIFSKSNIFIYPETRMEKALLQKFFRLESAEISFESLKSISVHVEERKPFAVWCASTIVDRVVTFHDDCYFIDKNGFVFSQAPKFSGNVYVRYYGLVKPDNTFASRQFFPSEEFKRVASFITQIVSLDFHITDAVMYEDTDVELYDISGAKILINTRENLSLTFENLKSLLNDKVSVPDKEKFLENLDYVDLRFGKKLFFKLR
ncbi:MAG: hypothetical protein U0522_03140 [Candidatus Paceibacterota bacterium]